MTDKKITVEDDVKQAIEQFKPGKIYSFRSIRKMVKEQYHVEEMMQRVRIGIAEGEFIPRYRDRRRDGAWVESLKKIRDSYPKSPQYLQIEVGILI